MRAGAEERRNEHPVPRARVAPEEDELEHSLRPRRLGRVRRPGARQGAARDRARGREGARRGARPRPARRARPGSARRASRTSSARSSASASAASPARRSSARATWPRSSPALEQRDVLFVDEIHRLNRAIEEILYPALEDFRLDIIVGQGPAARTLTLDLPPFTLVGATTRTGLLTTPLRDRFGMTFRLDYYDAGRARHDRPPLGAHPRRRDRGRRRRRDRAPLARHAAHREPHPAPRARRRRGAARRRDHARGRAARRSSCSRSTARPRAHRPRAARARSSKFGGGPVGLSTLAVALGEEPDTIEDVYEPYLLQLGFLQRTPRGRIVTELGREHLGAAAPDDDEALLSPDFWVPGAAAPSLDDFVARIHRQIERYTSSHTAEQRMSRSSSATACG